MAKNENTSQSSSSSDQISAVPPRRRRPGNGSAHADRSRRTAGRLAGGGQDLAESVSATATAADSDRLEGHVEPTWEDIARRAYFRFVERGGDPGHDQEDWLEAERELRNGY